MRQDLRDESLDEDSKKSIEDDIAALMRRKDEIAFDIGLKK